ncbi:TDRKH, partial [Symbiodinium sp. CCMP2456]
PFFRTDAGAFLDKPVCCSVLTAAAPNAGAAKGPAVKEVVSVLKARVVRVLRIAKANDLRTLILGAWGCGVFKNDPQEVARAFHSALDLPELRGAFDHVLFPIPDPKMKVQFERVLRPSAGAPATAAAPKAAAQAVAKVAATNKDEIFQVASEQEELDNREPSRTREHCDEGPLRTASGEDLQDVILPHHAEEEIAHPTKVCVELVSFGYSRGAGQPPADQHFDARGLENPDRGPRRHLTGTGAGSQESLSHCGPIEPPPLRVSPTGLRLTG